jgi:hypothetical protein
MPRALVWACYVAVGLGVAWVAVHFVLAPVNPRQQPPDAHVSAPCWTCHLVSGSVKIKVLSETPTE